MKCTHTACRLTATRLAVIPMVMSRARGMLGGYCAVHAGEIVAQLDGIDVTEGTPETMVRSLLGSGRDPEH